MEMMVAMSMAGIIGAAAIGAGMMLNRSMVDTRRRAVVWDEAKRVEEALLSKVQEAGGDPMASFQSIFVEDNCAADPTRLLPACAGADRITIVSAKAGSPVCAVEVNGANLMGTESPCCITGAMTGPAIFVRADGVAITLSLHSPNTSSCQVGAPPGQGNPVPPALGGTGTKGHLALTTVETLFPRLKGAGEYELIQWIDTGAPGNGRADGAELRLIADRIYDFQLALGYDGNPEDGEVLDANSSTDEWIGNAEAVGASLPSPLVASQLRMIDIAVAVGTPAQMFTNQPVQLLNRSAPINPTGIYLAATRGQVAFRNLNISVP